MSVPVYNILPNVVCPGDFNLPNSLTPYHCNMCIGFNDVGYGDSLSTGFYEGYTPPSGGWTVYYSDVNGNLFTQVAYNFDDLLQITNYISGQGTASPFTDATAILWYYGDYNQLGGTQILANYDLPNFVTSVNSYNNLALCFLSGYSMSYDSNLASIGFNYWIDLAQSNFLEFSGAFAINGSGPQTSMVFDGSTTYAQIHYDGNNFVPIENEEYTISVWFNPSSLSGAQGLVGWGNYGTDNEVNAFRLSDGNLYNYWWGNDLLGETSLSIGTWYNAVCTYNSGLNVRSIYLNGVLVASDVPSGTHNVTTNANLTVGRTWDTEYFNGKIQNVNIYNVCLTSDEILKNYYALQPIIY
jgi:hypothetical protein